MLFLSKAFFYQPVTARIKYPSRIKEEICVDCTLLNPTITYEFGQVLLSRWKK